MVAWNSFSFVLIVALIGMVVLEVECWHSSSSIQPRSHSYTSNRCRAVGGQRWGDFEGFDCKIIAPVTSSQMSSQQTSSNNMIPSTFNHMGDEFSHDDLVDNYGRKKQDAYNLNVGRAMETLRRQLPHVFAISNLDFSIFANQITIADGNKNRMVMQKSLYSAAVKSLQMAAAFSSIYPSMNVRKIEYIEESATIQCLVDVVLPDSVRVDGQAVWEGMFYFGLDGEGFINTHVFDRKISNLRPTPRVPVSSYPWLRSAGPAWTSELLGGGIGSARGSRGVVFAADEKKEGVLELLRL